jgi:hypothetical protein
MRRSALALAAALVAIAAAPPPCRVVTLPRIAYAPSDVRATVTIERHADNRLARLAASSVEYQRVSWLPLEGAEAARVQQIWWRALPAGDYEVRLTVYGPGHVVRASATERLELIDPHRGP